jgi:carbonic anhydrase
MCPSCETRHLDRRGFFAGIAAATATTLAAPAFAAGKADAIVLSCMDYRLVDDLIVQLDVIKGMKDNYDHVVIAGAALAAVGEKFSDWHEVFWTHVGLAIQLHGVHQIIAVNHRDCGAFKLGLGPETIDTPEKETATHTEVMKTFTAEARKRYPDLTVKGYLMALDGSVEELATV